MGGRPRIHVPPCRFCNKQFKRQEHLQRHLRTHTCEKPFACFCGQTFSRQDLCTRHQRLDHPTEADQANGPEFGKARSKKSLAFIFVNQPQPSAPPSPRSHSSVVSSNHQDASENGSREAERQTIQTPEDQSLDKSAPMGIGVETNAGQSEVSPMLAHVVSSTPAFANEAENVDIPEDHVMDTIPSFLMDTDFLWSEADMISNYLSTTFPVDFQLSPDPQDGLNGLFSLQYMADTSSPKRPHGCRDANVTAGGASQLNIQGTQSMPKPTDCPMQPVSFDKKDLDSIDEGPFSRRYDRGEAKHWGSVSEPVYNTLLSEVSQHRDLLSPEFTLPGRQLLSRYLACSVRGFSPHLPFLHVPSVSLEAMSPMLVLALAAVGAFYGFEHPQGYALYFASRTLLQVQLERRRRDSMFHLTKTYPQYAQLHWQTSIPDPNIPSSHSKNQRTTRDIEIIQALIVFIQQASWVDGPLVHDALAMTSQLAVLCRETLLQVSLLDTEHYDWGHWCAQEVQRRTLYSAYIVLNHQTICFNIPPVIINSELHQVSLPCSGAEWNAKDAESWNLARRNNPPEALPFYECIRKLLFGQPLDEVGTISAFGNYVLIHGLLQQISLERLGFGCTVSPTNFLPSTTVQKYEAALRAWQKGWDLAVESTLDPASPYGPLGFNSTATLRIAHIRLSVGLNSQCDLNCRNPETLAKAYMVNDTPIPARCPHLLQAVAQCIHALRIPVRVGIALVARTQHGHWSVQHSISNFNCARLLIGWLENMASMAESSGPASLEDGEKRLLSMMGSLIEETHFAQSLVQAGDYDPTRIRQVAIAAVKLWAETCKGIHVFEIVHVIGATLSLVAESLEQRMAQG